jgi:glycosyltransferase involved in cell wall biosynthesis
MRIGFDARFLHNGLVRDMSGEGNLRGIGVYQKNLIENLLKIDTQNRYIFFVLADKPLEPFARLVGDNKNVEIIPLPRAIHFRFMDGSLGEKIRTWQNRAITIPKIKQLGLDIMHFEQEVIKGWEKGREKMVITIFDLTNDILVNQIYKAKIEQREQMHTYWKKVDHVITISESSKNDIKRILDISEKDITVTPLDADRKIFKPQSAQQKQEVVRKYHIQKPYFIHTGGIYLNKNLNNILQAFSAFKAETKANVVFVKAGAGKRSSYRQFFKLKALIKRLGIESDVQFLESVPTYDLAPLYAASIALVHPSLYEGFGLALLEAMASGTAVIASTTSSMPEVVGPAGILVDPTDITKIKEVMIKIWANSDYRSMLIGKGFEQATHFSWQTCAKQTLQVYENMKI